MAEGKCLEFDWGELRENFLIGRDVLENLIGCVFTEETGVTGRAGELGQDDWVGAGGGVLVGGLCLLGEELVRMICLGRDIRPPISGKLFFVVSGYIPANEIVGGEV